MRDVIDGHQALQRALDVCVWQGMPDAGDADRVRSLISQGEDPWSRHSPLHVTGSALVIHPGSAQVLLRWHERQQAWLQVGGHADTGESDPREIALREAREETGLQDLVGWPDPADMKPVQVVIVPVPAHGDDPAHEHADIRYVFATARHTEALAESGGAPVRWLVLDRALEEITEENLREFLRRVKRLWS